MKNTPAPVSESPEPVERNFYQDLRAFKKKYPSCYIEAWTPEDFYSIEDSESPVSPSWSSPRWERVAARLYRGFDSDRGTNWNRVLSALRDVPSVE